MVREHSFRPIRKMKNRRMTPLVIKQVSYINFSKPVSSLQFDDFCYLYYVVAEQANTWKRHTFVGTARKYPIFVFRKINHCNATLIKTVFGVWQMTSDDIRKQITLKQWVLTYFMCVVNRYLVPVITLYDRTIWDMRRVYIFKNGSIFGTTR